MLCMLMLHAVWAQLCCLLQVNAGKCLPYAGSSNNPALGGCSPGYYAGGCCEDLTDCASCFAERFGAASCGWCAEGSKLNSGKCLTGALGRHVIVATWRDALPRAALRRGNVVRRCSMLHCVATWRDALQHGVALPRASQAPRWAAWANAKRGSSGGRAAATSRRARTAAPARSGTPRTASASTEWHGGMCV